MKKIKNTERSKPRNSRKEKFWAGSGKFFLILMLIYILFYSGSKVLDLAAKRTDVFKKEEIEISGNKLVSNAEILRVCGFRGQDKKEIAINVDSLAGQLMNLRYIKGISITRRPPRLLNITIEEYTPVAFIYGRGLNLIDGEGYLIPVPGSHVAWDLPFISGISQALGVLGKKSNAPAAFLALEIVHYLEQENPLLAAMISEINMSDKNTITLFLIKGGAKIRLSRKNFYKELYVLKNYIANYLDWRDLANIEYIDLRFENQLILKSKA